MELVDRLEAGVLIDKFINSDEWKLILEGADRVVEAAKNQLVDTPADQTLAIAELQLLAKLYKKILPNIVSVLRQEGKLAFEQLRELENGDIG